MNCEEANRFSMVDYLSSLGHRPKKERGNDCWYLSPLRDEKEPSFKVNKARNVWYDHGIGNGGTIVDFGIRYHRCSVSEFLAMLSFPFSQPQTMRSGMLPVEACGNRESSKVTDSGIIITAVRSPIKDVRLLQYAGTRNIEMDVLNRYCREVTFGVKDKKYTAIGFVNEGGGWELRNEYFQASSSPKGITLVDNQCGDTVKVFEGFFDFLSFQTLLQKRELRRKSDTEKADYLILNSLSFFKKSHSQLEGRKQIHLYLDRDTAGSKCTREALLQYRQAINRSSLYKGSKDLNDWHRQTKDKRLAGTEKSSAKRNGHLL